METIACVYNLRKKEEGHFLAHILQSREEIISARYNENGYTIAIEYDSEKIDSETIQKIVFYLCNNSMPNPREINKFINNQKIILFLKVIVVLETFTAFTVLIYIMIGILTDCENCMMTYSFFLLSLVALRFTILLKNKINRRKSTQTNYSTELRSIPN